MTLHENINEKKRVIIVGGGLVGSLQALFSSKRNHKVDVYESRCDPRLEKYVAGYSINLALSVRGREALKAVGAEDYIIKQGIPMYARMIHSHDGKRTPQPYGQKHQFILSIDRRELNEHLISLVDKNPNVTYHFNYKFTSGDFDKGSVTFDGPEGTVVDNADVIIGCDGAHSAVRRNLMKKVRMNYSQVYIPHGYKEIEMPPDKDGNHAMEINYLHIWPRHSFMLIALPNQNKTFTLTLFMPFANFHAINTDEDVMKFFKTEFPDAIPLIGEEKMLKEFRTNPTSPLISVKCSPYHFSDKVVIMGDAAHAMVPFYGQGMNCGFEDCLVLDEILQKHGCDYKTALPEYTITRNPDAEAIIDLAMYNYMEMRSHVNSPLYRIRKRIDDFLHRLVPSYWVPRYTMTTFSRIRYHEVVARADKQDKIIRYVMTATGVAILFAAVPVAVNVIWGKHASIHDKLLNLNIKLQMFWEGFSKNFLK